jgi:hypothetical protein
LCREEIHRYKEQLSENGKRIKILEEERKQLKNREFMCKWDIIEFYINKIKSYNEYPFSLGPLEY